MPIIQLPALENPRVVLAKIALEAAAVKEELDQRARLLEEMLTLSTEAAEVQAAVVEAKKTVFQLLNEQLRSAQLRCVEEYAMLLQIEIEELEKPKTRKGAPSP